jgi:hypothetical protein
VDELRVVHAAVREETAQAREAEAKVREDAARAQEKGAKAREDLAPLLARVKGVRGGCRLSQRSA